MSLKGTDDYKSLTEKYKLTKIPDDNQKPVRTVADIIGDDPDVRLLRAEAEMWRARFIAACVAIILIAGGLGFACFNFYTSDDDLAAEWEAGYAQGKSDGEGAAYDNGYNKGHSEGYDEGYLAACIDYDIEEFWAGTEDHIVVPEPEPEASTESSGQEEITVYVTDTGTKYHRSGCGSLWNSSHERSLSQAISQGYGPCGNCNPPVG